MDTLLKALLVTFIFLVLLIGLPLIVVLVGVAWPVLLVIAVLIFIPIVLGILIGKSSKRKET